MLVTEVVGGVRLLAECAVWNEEAARSALRAFAGAGTPKDGLTLRFGWSVLRLRADGEVLRVCEPDYLLGADRWIDTIDVTLDTLRAQAEVHRNTGMEPVDVGHDQQLLCVPGALTQPGIFLHRLEPLSAGDSGWVLGSLADPEALAGDPDLDTVPVAVLVRVRPLVLSVLTLPVGSMVVIEGDVVTHVEGPAG